MEALKHLEPLNALLVPLSEMPGWYRYHHLFAECLQDILRRRHGLEIPELHLRAASWFEQQGNVSETVYHASEAQDFDRCAALIQNAGGWELILFGGIGHLRNLLSRIPDAILRRYPRLQIAKAYLTAKDGDLAQTRALFNAARSSRSLMSTISPSGITHACGWTRKTKVSASTCHSTVSVLTMNNIYEKNRSHHQAVPAHRR